MGSHLLGADPIINKAGIFNSSILPDSIGKFERKSCCDSFTNDGKW